MRKFAVIDAPQQSDAWKAARLGRLTSSRANDMLATRKDGKPSASRDNLRVQLVLERITKCPQERTFQSAAMDYGLAMEPEAFAAYEAMTGQMVQRSGFLSHNELMAGCSLDGHVGNYQGIVEIKCPIPATHLDYLRTSQIPTEYLRQVQHALWVSGAEWADWMSYERSFPERLRTKIVRVHRSDLDMAAYALAVRLFLSEVEKQEAELREM